MEELYWIYVLGKLNSVAHLFLYISLGFIVVSLVLYLIGVLSEDYDLKRFISKLFKPTITTFFASIFVCIMIPNTKQLYTIMGVGTVIDYVQENKDLQQLPDKAVKALDAWLDKQLEEEKK